MKSYLEIQVPIRYDAQWFVELRFALRQVNIRWQIGCYHITMAFLNETPLNVNLSPILEKHLNQLNAPTLSFDNLDAFSTQSGPHIIFLTATSIPDDFSSTIDSIRAELKAIGCQIQSSFRLHVTLGRVIDSNITLESVQKMVGTVSLPTITLTLSKVDYREFRGKTIYETKLRHQ